VIYLRREDRREGYPLEDDATGRLDSAGGPLSTASPKVFRLRDNHGTVSMPNTLRDAAPAHARRIGRFPGAPLDPVGDPLAAGIGPGAYAQRAKRPDLDWEGRNRIVPLRVASEITVAREDADPRGFTVLGADGAVAGSVSELWIDRADRLVRYLEVALTGGRTVLVPFNMALVKARRRQVEVDALNAAQFAGTPALAAADTITLDEEERVMAYFGGGYLYATPARAEPWL
jgi:photosynthetic reaction center H subunit